MKTAVVAGHFQPLLQALVGDSASEFSGIDVSDAESCGQAEGLFLHETLGPYPSWASQWYSAYWLDRRGVRKVSDSPYPAGECTAKVFNTLPKVKLTHSHAEVQFNLSLGENWWARCKAQLTQHGLEDVVVEMIRRPDE